MDSQHRNQLLVIMAIFNGLKDNLEWEERNGTEPCNLSTAEKHIQIGWGQKKENWRPAILIR